MSLAKTWSESNFVTNWVSSTYRDKLQLSDSAACRKLQLKLAEMNLIDFCIMKEKKYALLESDVKVVVLHAADLLRYLDYLFQKAFSGVTQVKTKHMQRVHAASLKRCTSMPVNRQSSSFKHTISHSFQAQL